MPSPTDTLTKLYDKVIVKSNKLKASEKSFDTGSSPFMKPVSGDVSYMGSTTNDLSKNEPYKTSADIGDLPAGGGGHNSAPVPDNKSSEPFDHSAPSGEDEEEKKMRLMRTSDGEDIKIREQGEDAMDPAAQEPAENTGDDMALPADPATTDPSMNAEQPGGMDMGGMGDEAGGDMGMGGAEEEEKTPHQLGRIYELKKIYTRLTSIESYLASEADPELTEIRRYVSQSIELFEILASNIDSYKEKMDDIIISYYKFLKEIYFKIKDYYKEKSTGG
ncbi:MAG: hypothetical protein KGD64_04010 [Candidatus Heimdallarchaeota archaeon]|nr:hypothetical protein [Candidatus Heimdallarchaeota archaeon]